MNTCIYPQCESYVENKDKMLCASHNKLERKEELTAIKEAEKKKHILQSGKMVLKPKKALTKHSDNVHYEDSNGIRYSSKEIEKNIRQTKAQYLVEFEAKHGYFFCEDCKRTDCEPPFDLSHEISIDQCKKKGMVELAWWIGNFKLRGRKCHQKKDKTDLQWTVNK